MAALAYGGRVASPMTTVALQSIYSPVLKTCVSLLINHVSLLPVRKILSNEYDSHQFSSNYPQMFVSIY